MSGPKLQVGATVVFLAHQVTPLLQHKTTLVSTHPFLLLCEILKTLKAHFLYRLSLVPLKLKDSKVYSHIDFGLFLLVRTDD